MAKSPEIIFEDEAILVVDKPPGWLTIPTPDKKGPVLTDYLTGVLSKRGLSVKAHPCHRLDYETSGVVIYAKGKRIQQVIMKQFQEGRVKKKYLAVAEGQLTRPQGELKSYICDRTYGKEPRLAVTRYRIVEKYSKFTLVEVEPATGRTNQIRIHFRQLGYPLVGDRRFGLKRKIAIKFSRTALHAAEISFIHPTTRQPLHFTAPMPEDLKQLIY